MVRFRPFTDCPVIQTSRHSGRYRVASSGEWRSVSVRYPVSLPISRVGSPGRNLKRSWCRRMIFAKIIVPCDPPFVALPRRRRSHPGVVSGSFFGRQRAILRGFILQQLHASFLAIGAWCSSASRIGRLRFYRSRHSILQICYYYRLVQTFTPANAQITQQLRAGELLNFACV